MKYIFRSGDTITIPRYLHTETSMEETSGTVEGTFVRYCGDNNGIIRIEGRGEEMWNLGWMKLVKKFDKKLVK